MADMLYTDLPNFSRFSPLSLPFNLFPHTNSSFIRFAPLRRRFSLSSAAAKLSSDSSQFDIISRTELADGSFSFKFGDASEISEIVDKFDGGNDVELERESDDSLSREANAVTDDESDGSKAENFVRNSVELKENASSVVDLQSDVQICENSVEDEQNCDLISTAGVEDSSDFDATRHENRVGNGAVVICDSSVGVMIEKAGELSEASEELSDDDELEHGGDESSNIGGTGVVVSLEDEIVKDEIAKDEIVKDEIAKDEVVSSEDENEIVKDDIAQEDEVVSLDDEIEEDKLVSLDDEIVKDEIVKEGIVEDDVVKGEIMKDEIVKVDIVEEEIVEDEIVKDDIVKDDIVEDEIDVIKDQKVVSLDYEIVKDAIVKDEIVKDAIVKDEIGDNMELSLEDEIEENMVVSLEDETEKASVFAVSHPISVDEDDDSVELMSKKLEAEPILDEEASFNMLDDVVALRSSLGSSKSDDDRHCNDSSKASGPDPETSGIASAEVSINSLQISTVANSMTAAAASSPDTSEVHDATTHTIAQTDDDITDTLVTAGPVTSGIASPETDLDSLNEVETSSPAFSISSAVASLAHSPEALTGGKDVHFVSENWFGVADGVGQWSLGGVDMGMYAHEFMQNCEKLLKTIAGLTNVKELFQKSAAMAQSAGSARVLIAHVADEVLHVANIGDAGFVIIRNGTVFQKSSPMVHEFSFPCAIGLGDDSVEDVEEYHIDLEDGDVIVTATDGLFDNLYEQEIASMVSKAVEAGMSLQDLAELLATKADEVGRSESARSPFADAVQAAGHSGYSGGKLDHVTVIVSLVQRR